MTTPSTEECRVGAATRRLSEGRATHPPQSATIAATTGGRTVLKVTRVCSEAGDPSPAGTSLRHAAYDRTRPRPAVRHQSGPILEVAEHGVPARPAEALAGLQLDPLMPEARRLHIRGGR